MKRKYHKTGTLILIIFAAAVVCVMAIIFCIYQSGLRYMKTDTGVKYFGKVDSDEYITDGRIWFETAVANINLQKYYIVELNDETLTSALNYKDFTPADDILHLINENIPEEIKNYFPLNHFIFNKEDAEIFLHRDTFPEVIKKYEKERNYIKSGEMYTSDGKNWSLSSSKANPASYKDLEIIPDADETKTYKGDLLKFLEAEQIYFASFALEDGSIINLYPAYSIYRIAYERGIHSGDLYIGPVTRNLQKDGKGLYYYSDIGDIYYGDFEQDEKTGVCAFLFKDGGSYSGSIIDGKKEGEGILKWVDGCEYSGGFVNNMKNGRGIYRFENGEVYDGDWVDDVRHGQGKFTFATGDVYEGEFENDIFKGQGKYTWASGEYYEGSFMHDTLHGRGIFYWASGRVYDGWFSYGEMVADKPEDVQNEY